MSEQSAIRVLQSAIDNVRENCKTPDCKDLLSTLDAVDAAAEKALGEPDDSAEDKTDTMDTKDQPRDLKSAAVKVRQQFAQSRKPR